LPVLTPESVASSTTCPMSHKGGWRWQRHQRPTEHARGFNYLARSAWSVTNVTNVTNVTTISIVIINIHCRRNVRVCGIIHHLSHVPQRWVALATPPSANRAC
jgi:hypothetical protein